MLKDGTRRVILWRVRGRLRRDGQLGTFYGGQSERTATLRTAFSSASLSLSIASNVLLVFFLFSIVFVAGVLLLIVCFAFFWLLLSLLN